MRIKIINPDYGMTNGEIASRLRLLRGAVSDDVELDMECLTQSTVYLDSLTDAALAGPEIVHKAQRAERDGFDAVVLYCFSDPAIDACRELLKIPVIGAGQTACLTALQVARQFGIVVSDARRIPEKRCFVHACGVEPSRVAGYVGADMYIKEGRSLMDALELAGRALIDDSGAQAVVLGCLSYIGTADELSRRLGVPVIDAAMLSVAQAELLARLRLRTSETAYPTPPQGDRTLSACTVSVK